MLLLQTILSLISLSTALDCFPLAIPLCQGFGYTATSVPYEGQLSLQAKISMLVQASGGVEGCSSYLRPFLCYTFSPKCRKKYDYGIRPCQSTCRFIERHCRSHMSEYWPTELLNCDTDFLVRKRGVQCLSTAKLKGISKTTGAKPIQDVSSTTASVTSQHTTVNQTLEFTKMSDSVTSAGKQQFPLQSTLPSLTTERRTQGVKPTTLRYTTTTTTATTKVPTTAHKITAHKTTARRTTGRMTTARATTAHRTTARTTTARTTTARTTTARTTTRTSTTTEIPITPPLATTDMTGATAQQIWVAKIKNTRNTVSSTTPQTLVDATSLPHLDTTKTTETTVFNYTGPIFNPFYPPTFAKFEDPRTRTTAQKKVTTTPAMTTTSEVLTTDGSEDNVTTMEPWYKKVDLEWLVKQVNISLQAGRGIEHDYTGEWNLTNYIEYLDSMEGRSVKEPWYKQEYNDFIRQINIKSVEWKDVKVNGTAQGSPSMAERRRIFDQVFGLDGDKSVQLQADSAHTDDSSEGVVYPIFKDSKETEVDFNKTMEELTRVLNKLMNKYYAD